MPPDIVYTIIITLSILCALISIYLWKFANPKEKLFLFYIISIGFFELLAKLLIYIINGNNLPGLHAYTLVQFVLLTFFFNACFKELVTWFKYKWVLVIGVLSIVANSLFVQDIFTYNSYSKSLVELYIIVMSLILFILFIKDKTHDQISMKASVSFVSAVFLKSSVSIIFYMYSNELLEMKASLSYIIWCLKLGINYISLFMIMLGMSQIYTKRKLNEN